MKRKQVFGTKTTVFHHIILFINQSDLGITKLKLYSSHKHENNVLLFPVLSGTYFIHLHIKFIYSLHMPKHYGLS